jgi:hypothetical protein
MKRIRLTQGKFALIDDTDYVLIKTYSWCCHKSSRKNVGDIYYAATNVKVNNKYKTLHMHRLISKAPDGMDVDHINNNGLDNRRSNLKICSRSENLLKQRKQSGKSSKYVGVSLHSCGKWDVRYNKKYLGIFNNEIEASNARTLVSLTKKI